MYDTIHNLYLRFWRARLENLSLFKKYIIDGYICQSVSTTSVSPSSILSKYLEKPVHLVYKGPHPRMCQPTTAFPELDATVSYQDGYPLLFLSEESVGEVESRSRHYVGMGGVEEWWKTESLVVERCFLPFYRISPAAHSRILTADSGQI